MTVDARTRVPRSAAEVAPVARAPLAIAAAKVAFLLTVAGVWGIHRDEFYYLAGGRRLDWGYVDHPPVTPLLYRIDVALFGDSTTGLHVMPALLAGVLVFVGVLLARELGGGRVAQLITAVAIAMSPMFMTTSHFLSTVSVDILVWSIGLLLLARLLRTGDDRLWLAIGVVAGVGLMNKDTMAFWGVGVVAGLALTPERSLLRSPKFFVGALIAFALFVPNLVWQAQHDWPTIEFLRSLQSHTDIISNPLLYFPFQLVLLGPQSVLVWLPGVIWLLRSEEARRFRSLGVGYVVVLVLIFVLRGKAYYVGSWYPALFAAGAVRLERAARWPVRTYILVLVGGGVVSALFALPLVPSSTSLAKTVSGANSELGEMLGWDDMARQVADIAHGLPADEQANLTILTSNYSEAGAIEYWRSSLHLPQPISRQNNYWIWGYDDASEHGTVLAVGLKPEQLQQYFGDVRQLATVTNAIDLHNKEYGAPIVLCRDQRVPWAQIWSSLQKFS